ncbi:RING finger protein 37 [Armadillidium vulgare]|nr:RING finger protein 37 [Armadillidium vulgare]
MNIDICYHSLFPKKLKLKLESSLNTGSIIKAFKTRSFKNVGVSSLQLVLTSVSPNGPPGLKRLQIWGQPTLTVSPSLKSNIIKLWSSRSKKKEHEKINMNWFNSQPVKEEDNSEAVKEISNDEEKPIPEEFLDILTCEVMRLPILLPSGNSIDSSSLEKFLAIEATWGRSPSDPFTGIPFKENHKPEPNILLKARIDRFLLIEKNSSCLDGLGHTLLTNYIEKGPNNSQVQESKRLKLDNSSSRSVVSTNTSHRNSSCSSIVNNNSSSSSKKRVEISNASNKQEKVKKLKFNKINEEKRLISAPSRTSFLHTLGSAISSVQKNKSCVLLKGTKNPLTNVERSSVTTNVEDKSVECNDSKTVKYTLAGMALSSFQCKCGSQTGTFYSLKCEHKICHACLKSQLIKSNENKSIICNKCSAYSLSSDVVRVHPKSAFQI